MPWKSLATLWKYHIVAKSGLLLGGERRTQTDKGWNVSLFALDSDTMTMLSAKLAQTQMALEHIAGINGKHRRKMNEMLEKTAT